MRGIKKLLFGISLLLFGLYCLYLSWSWTAIIGLASGFAGIAVSFSGFMEQDE